MTHGLCENIIPCLVTYSFVLFSPHLNWYLGTPTSVPAVGSRELGSSPEVWEECEETDQHPVSAAGVGVDSHCWSWAGWVSPLCEWNIDPSSACVSLVHLGDLNHGGGWHSDTVVSRKAGLLLCRWKQMLLPWQSTRSRSGFKKRGLWYEKKSQEEVVKPRF